MSTTIIENSTHRNEFVNSYLEGFVLENNHELILLMIRCNLFCDEYVDKVIDDFCAMKNLLAIKSMIGLFPFRHFAKHFQYFWYLKNFDIIEQMIIYHSRDKWLHQKVFFNLHKSNCFDKFKKIFLSFHMYGFNKCELEFVEYAGCQQQDTKYIDLLMKTNFEKYIDIIFDYLSDHENLPVLKYVLSLTYFRNIHKDCDDLLIINHLDKIAENFDEFDKTMRDFDNNGYFYEKVSYLIDSLCNPEIFKLFLHHSSFNPEKHASIILLYAIGQDASESIEILLEHVTPDKFTHIHLAFYMAGYFYRKKVIHLLEKVHELNFKEKMIFSKYLLRGFNKYTQPTVIDFFYENQY
jgi:hypothetical protein